MVDRGEDLKTLNSDIVNLQRGDDMFFFFLSFSFEVCNILKIKGISLCLKVKQ